MDWNFLVRVGCSVAMGAMSGVALLYIWKLRRDVAEAKCDLEAERAYNDMLTKTVKRQAAYLSDEVMRRAKVETELYKAKAAVSLIGWAQTWN